MFVPRRIPLTPALSRPTGEGERFETVVVCEGEFKAIAIREILPKVGACALPGINMSRHGGVQEQLLSWLEFVGAKRVIVAFDNENKGDPRLASFKGDPGKRYDTQIWANFLGQLLASKGYETKVAWLPDDWRDEKGKADWDGALGRLRKQGVSDGEIAKAFREVLSGARPPLDTKQLALFDAQATAIIRNGVARKWNECRKPPRRQRRSARPW